MSETLVDQLPPLVGLQRALEELSIMQPPDDPNIVRRGALIEQVSFLIKFLIQAIGYHEYLHNRSRSYMMKLSKMLTGKRLLRIIARMSARKRKNHVERLPKGDCIVSVVEMTVL